MSIFFMKYIDYGDLLLFHINIENHKRYRKSFFYFDGMLYSQHLGSTDVSMATDKCNIHSLTLASLQTQIDINLYTV